MKQPFDVGTSEPPSLRASEPPSLRASEPPSLRPQQAWKAASASLDDPTTWPHFVRLRVADEVKFRFRDEIESEVLLVLSRYFKQQRRIVALASFVNCLIATFLARALRRAELLEIVAPTNLDYLPHPESQPRWAEDPAPALPKLRGPVQQMLATEVLAGKTCEQIAVEASKPLKEVSRQVRDLADLIASRRRGLAAESSGDV